MMRKLLFVLAWGSALSVAQAQDGAPSSAKALVQEGVALYDKGQYDLAVAKYEQALKLDPANETAQGELALTYNELGRNKEAVAVCEKLLKAHPEADQSVYITYGNSLDALKKPKDAAAAYQKGLAQHPESHLLYFNQGVMLAGQRKLPEAITSLQRAVALKPTHASSNMSLGALELATDARIPAIFALSRFLVLEPRSERAKQRLAWLSEAMMKGVSQQDAQHITLAISPTALDAKKGKPDDFGLGEILLASVGALALGEEQKDKTATEKFITQFGTLCRALAEQQAKAGTMPGFTWEFYVPYFTELEQKGHMPAFAYLTHATQPDAPDVAQWLAAHPSEVEAFQNWSKAYSWATPKP